MEMEWIGLQIPSTAFISSPDASPSINSAHRTYNNVE